MNPPISSADLLRAFTELEPSTDDAKRAIAQVLGLEWKMAKLAIPLPPGPEVPLPDPLAPVKIERLPTPVKESVATVPTVNAVMNFTLSGPAKKKTASVLWATPPGEFEVPPASPAPAEVPPLFLPRWTRAILSTALAARSQTGTPDVREIVSEIARGHLLRKLPQLYADTMAQQVQVLVDVGDSMLPFAADQRNAIKAVKAVAGSDRVAVLKFTGSPLRGAGTDDEAVWKEFVFPSSKAQILMLTDLGIGRSPLSETLASVNEWRRFGRELRRRGIACTVFLPYPAKRWPSNLAGQFRLVAWDRATTASSVKFSRRSRNT
jgi:hypothetical protein